MIFSLDLVTENSELNLTKASSLPILLEPFNLELSDEFTYQFCNQISQFCETFHVMPKPKTPMLDYNGFCNLVSKSDIIVNNLSYDLKITKESAMEQVQNLFRDKTVIVQAGGAQGTIYKVASYLQSAGSGLQILKAQTYLAVVIPTTGDIFFYGCGAIAGNNSIGKALITTADALALPMKYVEIMWNSYGNPIIQKFFGVPVILNMTQTFKTGPGYIVEEVAKYIPLNNKSLVRALKDKLIQLLS